jgi:hypothetical protein
MKRHHLLILLFFIMAGSIKAQTINRMEYYFDSDPGYGNGTVVNLSPGADVSIGFTLSTNALAPGIHKLCIRTRDNNQRWSLVTTSPYFIPVHTLVPDIARIEYYFDIDPGLGNGNQVPVASGTSVSQGFAVNTAGFSQGFHKLNIRARDTENRWSELTSALLYLPGHNTAPDIVKMEYYFDTDPGYGNAINLPFTAGPVVEQGFAPDYTGLSEGMHKLCIRAKNAENSWCDLNTALIYFADQSPLHDIVGMEYYFDIDPGIGQANQVNISAGTKTSTTFPLDTDGMNSGIHKLCLRVKNTADKWSETTNAIYFKQGPANQAISGMEYYFDLDPGFGNGIQLPVVAGSNTGQSFTVSTSGLGPGGHILYIRTRDVNTVWSETNNFNFSNFAVKIFVEGLFNPATREMNKALDITGDKWPAEVADHVTLVFRKNAPPHIIDHIYELEMRQDGLCLARLEGDYTDHYLEMKHRNSIAAWSSTSINTINTPFYDFSTSAGKAYGNNIKLLGNGIFGLYGGDVNQDGSVDSGDMSPTDNDSNNYVTGYLSTDVNGDGVIDSGDMTILDNNAGAYISVMTP